MKKLKNLVYRALRKIYISWFTNLNTSTPIPLKTWSRIRHLLGFTGHQNPLLGNLNSEICTGIEFTYLPTGFIDPKSTIGTWTMSKQALMHLINELDKKNPKTILECGSGLSTITLAFYAQKNKKLIKVISLEQDLNEANKNTKRLELLGLSKYAKIIHAPIDSNGNYQIDSHQLQSNLSSDLIDILIIDGPSGTKGCRVSTLPSLSQFCNKNATWYLDDALRDGELEALYEWSKIPSVNINGILPFSKGLAIGQLNVQ
jgi:predicted O-methyltransferase YrrM